MAFFTFFYYSVVLPNTYFGCIRWDSQRNLICCRANVGVGTVGRLSEIKHEVYMSLSNGPTKTFPHVYLIIVPEIL